MDGLGRPTHRPFARAIALGALLVGSCELLGPDVAFTRYYEFGWYLSSSTWSPDGNCLLVGGLDGNL